MSLGTIGAWESVKAMIFFGIVDKMLFMNNQQIKGSVKNIFLIVYILSLVI